MFAARMEMVQGRSRIKETGLFACQCKGQSYFSKCKLYATLAKAYLAVSLLKYKALSSHVCLIIAIQKQRNHQTILDFISPQLQNLQMTLKYKTPIRIHIESVKKINEQTSRYRLPFLKDEPSQQRKFSVNQLANQTFIISEVKPQIGSGVEKQANQKGSDRGEEGKKPKQPQYNAKDNSQRQLHTQERLQQIQITLGGQPQPVQLKKSGFQYPPKPKTELKLEAIELKTSSKLKSPAQTYSSHRNPAGSKVLSQKTKHHSSNNRYTDQQQNFADRSRESEPRQTDLDAKTSIISHHRNIILGSQRQVQQKAMHSSLKRVEREVWKVLAKSIERQELDENEANVQKLRSKLQKSKTKLSDYDENKSKKSKTKLSDYDENKSKVIAEKLKLMKQDKEEEDATNQNQNMYDQLPPISQDSEVSEIGKEANASILKTLDQLISIQQSKNKSKTALPLKQHKKQYEWVKKINPFFKKLNELGGCVVLNVGKIKFIDSGDLIFTEGEPISHICIILLGKVVLTKAYSHFKSYGLPGESLGEQALFDESKPYHLRLSNNPRPVFYKTQARAHTKMCILRINLRKFYKMSIQLHTIGQKRLFNLIENLFKINYLKKNAMLHQQVKDRLQTEILVNRKKIKNAFFYH